MRAAKHRNTMANPQHIIIPTQFSCTSSDRTKICFTHHVNNYTEVRHQQTFPNSRPLLYVVFVILSTIIIVLRPLFDPNSTAGRSFNETAGCRCWFSIHSVCSISCSLSASSTIRPHTRDGLEADRGSDC